MYKLIKTLQNKPESIKRLIMWLGVVFIMLAIFVFWISVFPSAVSAPASAETADLGQIPGVWQSLKEQFGNLESLWTTRLR